MTNLELYKLNLTEDDFIKLHTLDCRECPLKSKCKIILRVDCEAALRRWCHKEVKNEQGHK